MRWVRSVDAEGRKCFNHSKMNELELGRLRAFVYFVWVADDYRFTAHSDEMDRVGTPTCPRSRMMAIWLPSWLPLARKVRHILWNHRDSEPPSIPPLINSSGQSLALLTDKLGYGRLYPFQQSMSFKCP